MKQTKARRVVRGVCY